MIRPKFGDTALDCFLVYRNRLARPPGDAVSRRGTTRTGTLFWLFDPCWRWLTIGGRVFLSNMNAADETEALGERLRSPAGPAARNGCQNHATSDGAFMHLFQNRIDVRERLGLDAAAHLACRRKIQDSPKVRARADGRPHNPDLTCDQRESQEFQRLCGKANQGDDPSGAHAFPG